MCILDGAGQPVWPYCGTCCIHPSLALAAHSATIYSPPYNLASPFPVETCTNSVPTALIRLAFPQTHSDHHFAFSVRRCVSKSGTGPASPLQMIAHGASRVVNLRVLGIMADSGILLRHVRASCPGPVPRKTLQILFIVRCLYTLPTLQQCTLALRGGPLPVLALHRYQGEMDVGLPAETSTPATAPFRRRGKSHTRPWQ